MHLTDVLGWGIFAFPSQVAMSGETRRWGVDQDRTCSCKSSWPWVPPASSNLYNCSQRQSNCAIRITEIKFYNTNNNINTNIVLPADKHYYKWSLTWVTAAIRACFFSSSEICSNRAFNKSNIFTIRDLIRPSRPFQMAVSRNYEKNRYRRSVGGKTTVIP